MFFRILFCHSTRTQFTQINQQARKLTLPLSRVENIFNLLWTLRWIRSTKVGELLWNSALFFYLCFYSWVISSSNLPQSEQELTTDKHSQTTSCKKLHVVRHTVCNCLHIHCSMCNATAPVCICRPSCCVIALQRLGSVADDKTGQRGVWIINPATKPGPVSNTQSSFSNVCIWAILVTFCPLRWNLKFTQLVFLALMTKTEYNWKCGPGNSPKALFCSRTIPLN